jgi:hypothetical protein
MKLLKWLHMWHMPVIHAVQGSIIVHGGSRAHLSGGCRVEFMHAASVAIDVSAAASLAWCIWQHNVPAACIAEPGRQDTPGILLLAIAFWTALLRLNRMCAQVATGSRVVMQQGAVVCTARTPPPPDDTLGACVQMREATAAFLNVDFSALGPTEAQPVGIAAQTPYTFA